MSDFLRKRDENRIMDCARAAAKQAIRRGFWRAAEAIDPDGFVDAARPWRSDRDVLDEILGREMTPAEEALWLGTWRATLRDARPR